MPEITQPSRVTSFRWFAAIGLAGIVALFLFTISGFDQSQSLSSEPSARWLCLLFGVFSISLALLRFELSDSIFISISVVAFVAMVPLFGPLVTGWLAPTFAAVPRILQIVRDGRRGATEKDISLNLVRAFSLYGIYGIPALLSGIAYLRMGGTVPMGQPNVSSVLAFAISGFTFFFTNGVVMFLLMNIFGYSPRRRIVLLLIDQSIYLVMLPYTLMLVLSYGSLGFPALIALMFTGVVMNAVARSLARSREHDRLQMQRLMSMSNIGRAISLGYSRDELLRTVHQECSKVVDTAMFTIALYNDVTDELRFELMVLDGDEKPKITGKLGEGLTSWVVENRAPLLLGSLEEERRRGLSSLDDGLESESWLGVPMTVRDRVIGVISVQSWQRDAFRPEDVVMVTAVANQAAVALESLDLYSDLEALTFALEEIVNERTRDLRDANLRLQASDRTKNQFLANMSHELRTPLNSIIGFSTVLIDREQNMDPRMKTFLENIHASGTHLLELINDILDLSKIEAGRMTIDIERFDLPRTVASVERVMSETAREKGVRLLVEIDPALRDVTLDEGRLKQILLNLLSNSIKFSSAGTVVRLSVDGVGSEDSPIGVDSVRYRVSDSGIGIAVEELPLIFDQFYQTDPARRTRGGTGLGLSLVRNFAEIMGGVVEVESTLGEGSVFTVTLPERAEAPVDEDSAEASDVFREPIRSDLNL